MNMVARILKTPDTSPARFRASLVLPNRDRDLVVAEDGRAKAQERMHALGKKRESLNLDRAFHSPNRKWVSDEEHQAAVRELNAEIDTADAANREAMAKARELRDEFNQRAQEALSEGIADFTSTVVGHLTDVMDLLEIGAKLHEEARTLGLEINGGILGGCALGRKLVGPVAATIARMAQEAKNG